MPLYVYKSSSGNPLMNFIVGIVSLAVLGGLAFLMLPVMLFVVAIAAVVLVGFYVWAWWQSKKYASPEAFVNAMNARAEQDAKCREDDDGSAFIIETDCRIETNDRKKWKMNDVEDIAASEDADKQTPKQS